MAIECNCDASACRKMVKIFNMIAGGMLITLGVLRFVYFQQASSFLSIILSIYYILFGIVILLSEFGWQFIIKYFSFQEGYVGRGIFIIFIGILCFNNVNLNGLIGTLNLAFGIVILVFGSLSVIYGFNDKSEEPQSVVGQNPQPVAQQNYQDIRKV